MSRIKEQFQALFKRRAQQLSKAKSNLIFEVLVPVLLVAIGLAFSKVEFFKESAQRPLVLSAFPKQQILYNNDLLVSSGDDYTTMEIMKNFASEDDSFDLQMFPNTAVGEPAEYLSALKEFDQKLFDTQVEEAPFRYGSYFILEADRDSKNFKFATFVNTTSQDASAFYP